MEYTITWPKKVDMNSDWTLWPLK